MDAGQAAQKYVTRLHVPIKSKDQDDGKRRKDEELLA